MRLFAVVLLLLSLPVAAQSVRSVQILLTDATQQPLIGATVQLVPQSDTTKRLYELTDTLGQAEVFLTQASYQLTATLVGMKVLRVVIQPTDEQSIFRFRLEADAKTLSTVTVTARKPLMRQEDDKTIVDPEPIANSSTNAYELLTKTPGLFLDQEGHVYLSSTSPATIYINGREQRMSAEDMATLLKSMPPNSIDRIEIMRTPSAKYDASNTGGAVNIILKKGVKLGRTGSVTTSLNRGRFGNQSLGFSLNNGSDNRTSYLNLTYNRRNSYDQLTTSRQLPGNQVISQEAYTRTPGDALFLSYGLSYQPTSRWEVSLDGRANYGLANTFTDNTTTIRAMANQALLTGNLNTVQNLGRNGSVTQGFSSKYRMDTLGSELTTDVSYSYFGNQTAQSYLTQYQQPVTPALTGDGDLLTGRHFLTAKADWRQKLPHKITLEVGFRTSNQWFTSQSNYFTGSDAGRKTDLSRTNAFSYRDGIHSSYVQAAKPVGKFTLKAGLRAENTNMNGHQRVPADTTFRVNRTDFFPYVYLSRPVMSIAKFPVQMALIYRRSITRPGYDQLNPAIRYIDQYLYETGNPALQPQFTQNVEANLNVANLPILAIGQNYTQQLFSSVLYQNQANPNVAYRTTDNLGQNRETYFRMVAAIPPGGRYFFVVMGQYNHNQYTGQYDGNPLAFSRGSWALLTYHQVELDSRSTLQLNGFWSINGQRQFYALGNFGTVDMSINRKFLNSKLMLTLSASDMFYTNRNAFTLTQGNIEAVGSRLGDTRRVGFSLRYNIGFKKQREDSINPFNFDRLDNATK